MVYNIGGFKSKSAAPILHGNYDICPVCFWEDAPTAYDPDEECGCNQVSLNQAIKNYIQFGACREEIKNYVRKYKLSERVTLWKHQIGKIEQ